MSATLTLLHDNRSDEFVVADPARPALPLDAAEGALGWELTPEGLCQGAMCVPVDQSKLVTDDGLDLNTLADALQRPLTVNAEYSVAALGASHHDRATALASLEAPDFALPDLSGQMHTLSEQRGKKVLLVAYASW